MVVNCINGDSVVSNFLRKDISLGHSNLSWLARVRTPCAKSLILLTFLQRSPNAAHWFHLLPTTSTPPSKKENLSFNPQDLTMIQCIKALLDLDDTFKVIGGDVRELTKQQREIWNNKNKESPLRKHRSSPVSIIAEYEADYTDKNSTDSISVSAHAGLADSLLECEADIQKEQDMVFLQTSLAYKSSRSCKTLPTLEEQDGDDTDGENDEERTIVQKSLSSYSSTSTSCHTSPRRTNITEEEKHGVLDHLEIKLLKSTASEYALRGNEEEAIRTYKRALHLTRIEVNRIQFELDLSRDSVTKTPNNVRRTLRREWTEVALAIAEIRPMMAILYERIGDYERAMKCCNEARDVYERQAQFDRKENVTNSIAEARMTQMNHMTSKMQDAKDSYELRKQLHEDSLEAHRQICVSPDPSTRERLYEALFDTLSAALALELESLGEHHPQVSDTMEFLSKIQQERFEIDKSLESMSNAVSIAELSLGIIHPRTGDKYREIAKMFERAKRSEGDLDQAIRYYEKAIYAFENADGDHSLLIGSVLNDLGVLHIQRKQYDIAVQKLSDALAAYESLSTITNKGNGIKGGTYVEVYQIWRNLGECYALQKNWSSASMAFKSALGIQRDARKLSAAAAAANASFSFNDDDDSTQSSVSPALISDENIADTLKRLGKSFAAQQNYNPSMNAFLEALTLLQTVYDKEPTQEKQDQVANILYCLAEVKKSNEKYSEALRLYEESLELRMLSDRFRPEKEKTNHSHCAMCLAGIGSIRMARKEYEHAFKAYNEALICTRNQSRYMECSMRRFVVSFLRSHVSYIAFFLCQSSQNFIPWCR